LGGTKKLVIMAPKCPRGYGSECVRASNTFSSIQKLKFLDSGSARQHKPFVLEFYVYSNKKVF